MSKLNKNLKIMFAFLFLLITCFSNMKTFAVQFENVDVGKHQIYCEIGKERYIKYKNNIQLNYDYHYYKNNERIPAYCLNLGVDGPESSDEFFVDVNETVGDKVLLNIVKNGFPYNTCESLGVNDDTQAKYATQFAVWVYLAGLDINQIYALEPKYENVVNAIKNIYYNGINEKNNDDSFINLSVEDFKIYDKDKNYYVARVRTEVKNSTGSESINTSITSNVNFKIYDKGNNLIQQNNSIKDLKDFSIFVDRNDMNKDASFNIKTEAKKDVKVFLYGKASKEGTQNLGLISNAKLKDSDEIGLNIQYTPQTLKIKKVDKNDNSIVIPGVKFRIYDKNNKLLGEYVTDNDGIITVDYLKELGIKNNENIVVEEIEVPDGYYIDKENNKKEITLKFDSLNEVVFQNEKITGKVKVIKKSANYNPYTYEKRGTPLKGCEFEIYDSNMKLVQKIVTNEEGIANSDKLFKGKYYIKESKSNEYYILDRKVREFYIEDNDDLVEFELYNDSMERELPKTGF